MVRVHGLEHALMGWLSDAFQDSGNLAVFLGLPRIVRPIVLVPLREGRVVEIGIVPPRAGMGLTPRIRRVRSASTARSTREAASTLGGGWAAVTSPPTRGPRGFRRRNFKIRKGRTDGRMLVTRLGGPSLATSAILIRPTQPRGTSRAILGHGSWLVQG